VGSAGRVTALDPTPFMVELLHSKYDRAPRIEVIEGSIENAKIPDKTFDVVLCHQVVQYLGDLPNAFEQMHRVLKPGGTLGVGVWSGPEYQEARVLEDGFRQHLGESFAPIHAWSFGGLDRLKDLAEGAGFTIDVLEKQVEPGRFKSVDEFMNVHIAGGMRTVDDDVVMVIFDLTDVSFAPKVDAFLADLRGNLGQFEEASGLIVPFASDVVIATA
jgi:ubiquinone/menaquinone biosynthesis C-methylase UbiE